MSNVVRPMHSRPRSAARAAASAGCAVAMAEPQTAAATGAASRPRVVGFVNRLSGGQMGARVFEAAQKAGLDAVYDLSEGGPRAGLDALLADPASAHGALLVCFGGDGTFNWVASTVLALRSEGGAGVSFTPCLVPCPLGTGNDLARSMGWGAKFPGFEALPRFVRDARAAPRGTEIDIWRLGFDKTKPPLTRMQNYFSVGVDAEVSRRFDRARSANPERFRSQLSNKIKYATMGASLAFSGAASLDKRLASLRIDDVEVALPPGLKSVLVLNIPSYGAGTHPWGDFEAGVGCMPPAHHVRRFASPAIDDGKLEVIGMFGILNAAMLHNPLSIRRLRGGGGKRLGQGTRVELRFWTLAELEAKGAADVTQKVTKRPMLAVQTDGEAWHVDSPGERIEVTLAGRVGAPFGPEHRGNEAGWPFARCVGAVDGRAAGDVSMHRGVSSVEGRQREPYI